MFIRIQVTARRAEHLNKNAPVGIAYSERTYENDIVGEMQASEDGAKLVNAAIDRLVAEEAKLRE